MCPNKCLIFFRAVELLFFMLSNDLQKQISFSYYESPTSASEEQHLTPDPKITRNGHILHPTNANVLTMMFLMTVKRMLLWTTNMVGTIILQVSKTDYELTLNWLELLLGLHVKWAESMEADKYVWQWKLQSVGGWFGEGSGAATATFRKGRIVLQHFSFCIQNFSLRQCFDQMTWKLLVISSSLHAFMGRVKHLC